MPIVNYVREIERFIEYAADKQLTANERCLWYGLMHIFNMRANGNEWPGGFIPITNDRVFTYCPGGFDTLARTRNRLKQLGLIDFHAGNRNKAAPEYKMNYQCLDFYPENTDKTGYCPQNTDNMRDNIRDNVQDNTGGNVQGNMGYLYPNKNTKGYGKPVSDDEEEEEEDSRAGAREGDVVADRKEREAEIAGAYQRFLGRNPYPAELDSLVWYGHSMCFPAIMVAKAVEIAAREGARKPVAYVGKILEDWKDSHVMQPHQVDGYQLEEDIRRGKAPVLAGTGDTFEDWKARENARENRRQENVLAGIEEEYPEAREG